MYYSEKNQINELVRYLENRLNRNEAIIERTGRALERNRIDGKLDIMESSKRRLFYRRLNNSRIYLKQNDPLIPKLANSDYNKELITKAKKENVWIRRTIKSMPPLIEDIYSNKPIRRKLANMQFMTDEELIEAWLAKENSGNPYHPEHKIHETDNGEMVRSKSERDIANIYKKLGIPYRYEYPINLKGYGTAHPDFMMFSATKQKEFFHEHLGMMDDPEYVADAIERIQAYERNGIVEGDRLILTFEDKAHPFNPRAFEAKIKAILLQD